MLNFELPWLFLLLPLPWLAYRLLPKARQVQAAVRVPFYDALADLPASTTGHGQRSKLRISSLLLIWLCLLSAGAGPLWLGEPIQVASNGRDLLLAVDLSGSMEIEDMIINGAPAQRITAVKSVLREFISRRQGDRLGLVLFGTKAYVQAPLSFDRVTLQRFLKEAQIGFAGEKQTAIGDAIGLSVKRLRQRPGDRHIMILLTDGQNTGGEVKPIAAAKLAAANNIIIYTVGVGADEMVVGGFLGSSLGARTVNPAADLDEKTLQEIADLTGGQYFRARSPEQLNNIYQLLDQLEPVDDKQLTFRPQQALFFWPLALALLVSLVMAAGTLPRPRKLLPAAGKARPL